MADPKGAIIRILVLRLRILDDILGVIDEGMRGSCSLCCIRSIALSYESFNYLAASLHRLFRNSYSQYGFVSGPSAAGADVALKSNIMRLPMLKQIKQPRRCVTKEPKCMGSGIFFSSRNGCFMRAYDDFFPVSSHSNKLVSHLWNTDALLGLGELAGSSSDGGSPSNYRLLTCRRKSNTPKKLLLHLVV
ncbi:hypothetical protein MUK42_03688 [Musa troglodytarum]|uniref:Uncharacterized protein n=1 Tax=Musa troglodytarum TaxID=320322 RepID=A0A9E7HLL6_9LILI|nr:hypothetical protein MUK42_03688 [Musa troglodytarum]